MSQRIRLAVALGCILAVPTGLALAQSGSDDIPEDLPPELIDSYLADEAEANKVAADAALNDSAPGTPGSYVSPEPVPDEILAQCADPPPGASEGSFLCKVLEAKAAGDLPPGEYSTEQLERLVGAEGVTR